LELFLSNISLIGIPVHINCTCSAEFTTMAGRRLREAVKEVLVTHAKGEFGDDTHIVIAGLTNTYSQYVATFEEYEVQRYEVSTYL